MNETKAVKNKAVLLFSGGFDSVILLHDLLERDFEPVLLFIDYGQNPLEQEIKCAKYWAEKYNLKTMFLKIPTFSWSKSSMFEHGDAFTMESDNDYVELRNLLFFSYAASMAESIKSGVVASAILESNFKDTTNYFCKSFDSMLYTTAGIELFTPYVRLTKEELAKIAFTEFKLDPVEVLVNTISCNVLINDIPCGECPECKSIFKIGMNYIK